MSRTHHHAQANQSSLPLKRPVAAKAPRAAPPAGQQKASGKSQRRRRSRKEEVDTAEDGAEPEKESMSTFLQYCAICDKQMIVPNSSFLYCSEFCRRVDAMPSDPKRDDLRFRPGGGDAPHFGTQAASLPRYVPALRPTPRPAKGARMPPHAHESKTDLDPTEWKPAEWAHFDDDYKAGPTNAFGWHSAVAASGPPAVPALSRASSATASSSSSSLSDIARTPPSLVSAPTTSVNDATALGLDRLSLLSEEGLRCKKQVVRPGKKSVASGSLQKLLAGGADSSHA